VHTSRPSPARARIEPFDELEIEVPVLFGDDPSE